MPVEKIDPGIETAVLLAAEIDVLIRRLLETDPDGLLRVEQVLRKIRVERCVERYFN